MSEPKSEVQRIIDFMHWCIGEMNLMWHWLCEAHPEIAIEYQQLTPREQRHLRTRVAERQGRQHHPIEGTPNLDEIAIAKGVQGGNDRTYVEDEDEVADGGSSQIPKPLFARRSKDD